MKYFKGFMLFLGVIFLSFRRFKGKFFWMVIIFRKFLFVKIIYRNF